MPLPKFPAVETDITGFTNLMDMNKVLTKLEKQKQSYQQGKVEKSTSLSEANINKEILSEYHQNLKLLLKTIDENRDGFFIYSIVNMFEFYAQNILPKYSLEERLKLYPEFGMLLAMALAINFEQQKLLVYKLAEDDKANDYWRFLKTKVGVSARPVLSCDVNYQEMFSLRINEIIHFAEIIFFNDAAGNSVLQELGVSPIKAYKFADFDFRGRPSKTSIQGNEAYIQEFLDSSDIKPKFEDIQQRTLLQTNYAINGLFSSMYGRGFDSALSQLGVSNSNIFSFQRSENTPSGINQELFDKWVEKNKPARYANLKVYIEQIKIFSLQQSQAELVEGAAEVNDLAGHSFDIYLQYALNQAIDLTKQILEDNKAADRGQKLKILSQFAGGGLLNFFQYFCTRYHGYPEQLADLIDAFVDFVGDDFEFKATVISTIHYSVGISKNNYTDDRFWAYRENMPVILSKLIQYAPLYLLTSKDVPPFVSLFYEYGVFPDQKAEFETKISTLLSSDEVFKGLDIKFLEYIKADQYFVKASGEASLYKMIESSCPEVARFLKLCLPETLKFDIDYFIKKADILNESYRSSKLNLSVNIQAMEDQLKTCTNRIKKQALQKNLAYNNHLLLELEKRYQESTILFKQKIESIFSTFDHALPLFSLETIENLLGELQTQNMGEELKPEEKLKLQKLLAEALFTANMPKGKKPQFVKSNFAILLNKGSKKILELITQVKLDPSFSKMSAETFKSYFYQQSFITLLSAKNFDNLNYLYSLDEEFFDTQFIPTSEDGQFITMVKSSLARFSFDDSLALLENIIDSELARFLKQTLIFNENIFPRFDELKPYFDNELIISSFFSSDNFKETKFYQYIAAKNYDALNILNAIDDKELKAKLFVDTAKFLEVNDAEALAKLVQIDLQLYQQCLDQGVISTNSKEAFKRAELLQSIESAKDSEIDDILPQIAEDFSTEYISKYLFGSIKFEATKFYTFLIAGSKEVVGFLNEKFLSDVASLSEFKFKAFSILSNHEYYISLDELLKQNLEFFESAFETNEKFRDEVIGKVEALNIEDLSLLNDAISSQSFLKKLINLNIALKTALSSEEVTQELDQKLKDFSIYNSAEISELLQKPVAGDECRPLCYELIKKGSNVILSLLNHLKNNQQNQIFLYGCFHELIVAKRFDDLSFFCTQNITIINDSFKLDAVNEEFTSEILATLSKEELISLYEVAVIVRNIQVKLDAHIIKLFSDDIKLGQTVLPELAFYQENFLSLCSDYVFNQASREGSRFFNILSSNEDLARVLFRDFCQEPKKVVVGEELLIHFLREGNFDSMQALLSDHPVLCNDILAKPAFKSQLKAICDNIKDADTIQSLKAITSHSQFASLIQKFLNPLNREFSFLRNAYQSLKQFAEKEKAKFAQEFDESKSSILAAISKADKKYLSEIADLRQEVAKEKGYNETALDDAETAARDVMTANMQLEQKSKDLKQQEQQFTEKTKQQEAIIRRLQEDLKQKQSQLDSKDLASTKQREELQSARKGFKLSEQEISKLRAELQKTKVTLSHQEQENQTLKRRLEKLSKLHKEKVAELETRNEGILERENNAKGKVLTQTSQLEKQQKEIVKLQKKAQAGDEEKAKLVSDNARLREEIKSVTEGSSEELQKANAAIAILKQELAAKASDTKESRSAGQLTKSMHPHTQRFQDSGQVPGFVHPQKQRSQAAAEQANFSVSKSLFKQQFYNYFDLNCYQDGPLNLKSRIITNGYIQGYVNCELVARELKIAYNAGDNCFFPVSKEELDRKLDEYFERPRSQSSRQFEPIFSLIQILPIPAYGVSVSSVNHGYSGNGRS